MISEFLTHLVVDIAIDILAKTKYKAPSFNEFGETVLRVPKMQGILGLLSLLMSVVIMIVVVSQEPADDVYFAYIMTASFSIGGILLLLQRHVYAICYNEQGVRVRTVFGREKRLLWKEVRSIRFNTWTKELVIKASSTKICCYEYLYGFSTFVKDCARYTKIPAHEMNVPE